MSKLFGFSLLLVGAASSAFAGIAVAPEIDGASAASAVVRFTGIAGPPQEVSEK